MADVDTPEAPETDTPSDDELLDKLWEDEEARSIAEGISQAKDPRMQALIEEAIDKIVALGHTRGHVVTYLEDDHAIFLPNKGD